MFRTSVLLSLVAAVLFAAALYDQAPGLGVLGPGAAAVLSAIALASLVLSFRVEPTSGRWALCALLLGASVSLGLTAWRPFASSRRSFSELLDRESRGRASLVKERFRNLTAEARSAADGLAAALEEALRPGDPSRLLRAFDVLESWPLPRAHPAGAPGASLFDGSLRPVAWAGENRAIDRFLSSSRGLPRPELAVLRRAAETSLVAVHPLSPGEPLVSVEVPLAADRELENRYLRDYDALSDWAGRGLDAHFFSQGGEKRDQEALFESLGDPYWAGPDESPRLFLGLRTSTGDLLGVASLPGEALEPVSLERSRRLGLVATLALVLSAGAALAAFASSRPRALSLVAAIIGFRLVLRASGIPLSFGLDLDNPAHYASSLFFGLARSPAEFFATTAAVLLSSWVVARSSWTAGGRLRLLAPALAIGAFLFVVIVVFDAWLNSSLSLSEISFGSGDGPRLTVQLGLVALFFSAALLAEKLLLSTRTTAVVVGFDLALIAVAYAVLSPRGHGDAVVLSALPLGALRLLARRPSSGIDLRAALVLLLTSIAVFYPAVAWFERSSIRHFIESTVAPVVLQHAGSRWPTLVEAAQDIDRMYAEGALGDLGREDLAFTIWVASDLSQSSLSSSVEVLDPLRRVVSRFSLNLPALAFEGDLDPAPEEWLRDERRFPGDPDRPEVGIARRSFLGPEGKHWEIRLGVAADWRNLPFISTSDPYLQLFRASAAERPLRYPNQEIELFVLTPDGRTIFQSVGGNLGPGEELLTQAIGSPLWWEHPHEGQVHRTYLVPDADYIYALSFPKKLPLDCAAELTRWILLGGMLAGIGVGAAMLLAAFGVPTSIHPRSLVSEVASSFSGKLYAAFVALALASLLSLAFLIRGIVIRDVQRDVDRESLDRALVAEHFVKDIHLSRPPSPLGMAPLTDEVMQRVAALAEVDVNLYIGGQLLATSKPELVASGLVGSRAAPVAQREIVLERRSHFLHRESIGSFQYFVVSVPILLEPWTEPGILSIPLASRQVEIDRRVASLNQTLLLAAVAFSIAAAALAYFLARAIADPIRELTDATHAVAEGRLDVSLETSARDEIGVLFSSFNQMTEDLKREREDLEKSKKLEAWAEMARQVAHEVKNPLTPIQLSTEHVLRVYGDPEVDFEKVLKECSETILQQVKTLRQISMEFSTFASPGLLEREPTEIGPWVREVLASYQKAAPAGIRIEIEAEGGLPPVDVDRRLLERTLVNLMENALYALKGEGTIEVKVTREDRGGASFVAIAVRDDGVGIDPEARDRVFEPYFSTRAAGTGLGLAIARKVVEDHGGTIGLESAPGEGTEVTIRLPV